MKASLIAVLCTILCACGEPSQKQDEIVDTTLNDAQITDPAQSNTMNVDEELTTDIGGLERPLDGLKHQPQVSQRLAEPPPELETDERLEPVERPTLAHSPMPRVDVRSVFSADDYPASAQASGAQGTVQASLTIGLDGRVIGCSLIRSSGHVELDNATCNILRRRALFTPARDDDGNPVAGTVITPPINWRLEG